MTEPSEPDRSMADGIKALRHQILSDGRNLSWTDVRGRIRRLIKEGRPSDQERIQLLELYDRAVTMVARRLRPDQEASRTLGRQRASDTLLFMLAEVRDHGGASAIATLAIIIEREVEAGRMHFDDFMRNVMAQVLRELDR